MSKEQSVPVLGFAAFSGTGKTTLVTQLLPILRARGYRVGVVKHAHHSFDVDKPGKDSYELRKAGAVQTLVASGQRWALVTETEPVQEPRLQDMVQLLDPGALDLVLVEGFKNDRFPKIELHRPSLGHPLLYPDNSTIVAIASDAPLETDTPIPVLDLNRVDDVAEYIIDFANGPHRIHRARL